MRRVLVVDDEPDILSTLSTGLPMVAPGPLQVQTASSGEEARRILQHDAGIHVVLCDARMPGMSGLELLAWMKRHGHPAQRVLVSAYSPRVFHPDELAAADPTTVCTKPLNLRDVARHAGLLGAIA